MQNNLIGVQMARGYVKKILRGGQKNLMYGYGGVGLRQEDFPRSSEESY